MTINGQPCPWQEGDTLHSILERAGYKVANCAALVNGVVVKKTDFGTKAVEKSDAIEVVSFVGGG